ncbi:hypothetical protein FACS1894111_05320 [Clostridia bacterium]|nr:hypothetical protein FACS1894111_05320 [Clostridia bacterium]
MVMGKKNLKECGVVVAFGCALVVTSLLVSPVVGESKQVSVQQVEAVAGAVKEKHMVDVVTSYNPDAKLAAAVPAEKQKPDFMVTASGGAEAAARAKAAALPAAGTGAATAPQASAETAPAAPQASAETAPAAPQASAETAPAAEASTEATAAPAAEAAVPEAAQAEATAPTVTPSTLAEAVAAAAFPSEAAVPEAAQAAEETQPSPWESKLMPKVEDYLSIHTEASRGAKLAGKLPKGAVADVLEKGEDWSKIRSGNVEGYVKNEYCVFGADAENMANEQGITYATSLTESLRIRAAASEADDSAVVGALSQGSKIKVVTGEQAPDGWVAVENKGKTAYVSAEFVSVELELGKAISIEEEQAAIKKAKVEAAAKKAAAASKARNSAPGTRQGAAVDASYDDLTLLAALIECEAGTRSYEGELAVGAVVMNRVKSGMGGGTISGVIYQSGQFTPVRNGSLSRVLASGVNGNCISAAQAAISGSDNTGGAKFFHSAKSAGAGGVNIGGNIFY